MANNKNLKPFQKGDPRINRRGRPRNQDIYKELARKIFHEEIKDDNTGVTMPRIEAILREWATSKEFRKQLALVQFAFGKPPKNEPPDQDMNIIVNWDRVITTTYEPRFNPDLDRDLNPDED